MAHPARRQADIVAAVWQVILHRGIAGVSVRAVADAAQTSAGLVQHYFPKREQLVRTSLEAMIKGSAARFRETPRSSHERIRHLVSHGIPTTPQQREAVTIWNAYLAASVTDAELARLLREAKRGQEQALTEALQTTGLPEAAAISSARLLIALADGLASRVVTGDLPSVDAVTVAEAAIAEVLARRGG